SKTDRMEDGADAEGKRFPGARAAEVTLETQATEIIGSRGIRGGLRRVLVHRLARVAYAGATSALVDFSIFNVLLIVLEPERTTHILLANSAAFIGAMVVNYTINSRIT